MRQLTDSQCQPVCRLAYVSKVSSKVIAADVVDILTKSRERNADRGITGAMVFTGRYFLQILEGDEASCASLFETIARDRRHTHVQKLLHISAASGLFPQEPMGFVTDTTLADDIALMMDTGTLGESVVTTLVSKIAEAVAST